MTPIVLEIEKKALYKSDTKKRTCLKLACNVCGEGFWVYEKDFKKRNESYIPYCSLECRQTISHGSHVCDQCGETFTRLKSKMAKSKSGFRFCSRECKDLAQRIGGIEAIHPAHYGTVTGTTTYRVRAFEEYEHKCSNCGYDEYESLLEVHHIDENRANNSIDNFVILCTMCHRKITLGIAEYKDGKYIILK